MGKHLDFMGACGFFALQTKLKSGLIMPDFQFCKDSILPPGCFPIFLRSTASIYYMGVTAAFTYEFFWSQGPLESRNC